MSNVKLHAERTPHDLGRFVFTCGDVGRLKVIDATPVVAGDSYSAEMVGAMRLSALRRGLAIDSKVDICTFYIPHRHVYGQEWNTFMLKGRHSTPLSTSPCRPENWATGYLGIIAGSEPVIPKWLHEGYCRIYDNYFCMPEKLREDGTFLPRDINGWANDDLAYGQRVCHLKNIWTAGLPADTQTDAFLNTESGLDIMGLQQLYAQLHTDQERTYFMNRYRDVMESFGGKTVYDADQRPHMLMRSEFWASGYDVDGTDQTSLGQFSGRVQQSFNHRVPRFFVPEHGSIITVAVMRFPPIHQRATPYYIANPRHSYQDFACDPAIDQNMPPRQIPYAHLFREGSVTNHMIIPHGQWFRSVPDYVDERYGAIEGFPFLNDLPMNEVEASYVDPKAYDHAFQTMQLRHWNAQIKTNVTVLRAMPDTRESILTSA